MRPNLRGVVAQVNRSIGSRNFSSSSARRRRRNNESTIMGGRFVGGNLTMGQSHVHQELLEEMSTKNTFRVIRPNRQRRKENKLLAQRREELKSRWKKLSKEAIKG